MRSLWFVLAIAAACGKNTEPPPPSSGSPTDKPESGPAHHQAADSDPAWKARTLFQTMCANCHGPNGKGDGPMAASLTPKPRDYTDAAWQASVTDDQIRETIVKGGAAVGKSPVMPGWPELGRDSRELDAMVQIIRDFGKRAP